MGEAGGYEREFVAEFYDHIGPYQSRSDVKFFIDAARRAKGPVLEVGCGTGRILIPTAREEIAITGVDLSPFMLDICQEKLSREPAKVQSKADLVLDDMRDFELPQRYMLATTPFRSFQHLLSVDDQIACLTCIHRHLAAEERLILDIFNPYLEVLIADNVGKESGDEPSFSMPDGRKVKRRVKFVSKDKVRQLNNMEFIYYVTHPDGREERLIHSFSMRYLFRYEAEHLLSRCGFEVEDIYSDFDKSPFGSKYPGELLFVAKKR